MAIAICGKSMEVLEITLETGYIWRVLLVLFQQQSKFFYIPRLQKSSQRRDSGIRGVPSELTQPLEIRSFFMNRRNSSKEVLYFYSWICDV